ncbi:hypothetical protein CSB69_3491 [Morganella morganii]|nr:hypothetical protein CSB69_3491 [Morganella morganii]
MNTSKLTADLFAGMIKTLSPGSVFYIPDVFFKKNTYLGY